MATGLLVSYAGYPHTLSSLFPDNGLAALAAALRVEGHGCQVLDLNTPATVARLVPSEVQRTLSELAEHLDGGLDEAQRATLVATARRLEGRAAEVTADLGRQLADRCEREGLDFVGFKLWSGDGFEASVAIAEAVRARVPGVKLFAGGPAVGYSGHVVPSEAPVFDAVIGGDGEEALLELARHAEGRRTLEGLPNRVLPGDLRFEPESRPDLTALPPLDYGEASYPAVWDGGKLRVFGLDEGRGCPMRCAFCVNRRIEGPRWRTRTPEQVMAQIRAFRDELGSRAFRFTGSYAEPRLLRAICEQIAAEGLEVTFGLYLHAGATDEGLLSALRQAGCFGVFYGVESGSDRMLRDAYNKSTSAARLRAVLTATAAAGLFTAGSFIFPGPGEDEASAAQTRALVREVWGGGAPGSVIVNVPGLIPGTTWWTEHARLGFQPTVDSHSFRRIALRYRIRHLLPPTMWEPMPYRLDGKTMAELAPQTAALQRWVAAQGIVTNLPDHDALVGEALGVPAHEFGPRLQRLFFSGDAAGLQALVDRANEALSA